MAQTFSKNTLIFFDKMTEKFEKNLSASMHTGSFQPPGKQMQRAGDEFHRPVPYISSVVSGMDITGQYGELNELVVPSRLSHIDNVPWILDTNEMRDERHMERKADSAAQALAAKIETRVAQMVAMTGGQFVKRGALSGWDDVAEADTMLTEIGVPADDRYFAFNARDYNKVASNLASRQTVKDRVEEVYGKGHIGPIAGFQTYKSDVLPRITAAAGGATLVSGAGQVHTPVSTSTAGSGEVSNVDNRYQLLTVDNTVGVTSGDAFTIAGVNALHLITKEDTGRLFTNRVIEVVNGTTLKVLSMITTGPYANVSAAPGDGVALTWLNTVSALSNVFWQGGSIEIIKGDLAADDLTGVGVMRRTTEQGLTIIMGRQGGVDGFKEKVRFTVFYGVTNLDPLRNGVMLGGQS